MEGYSSPEKALACGMMLRECIRFPGVDAAAAAAAGAGDSSLPRADSGGRGGGGAGAGAGASGPSSAASSASAATAAGGDGSASDAAAGVPSANGFFLHETLLLGADGGLSQPLRQLFEEHVHNPNFEVSADAFETLTTLLTTNKAGVFQLFNPQGDVATRTRFDELFGLYNQLLQSDNYVLKRQSLRLLGEFLLDRDNFAIMMQYISDRNNLKVIMGMLRNRQPNIQFEAFHVFKVFVANPEKPADIADILAANRDKLVVFLRGFLPGKDDPQFAEEKAMLIETLLRMQAPAAAVPATPMPAAEPAAAAPTAAPAAAAAGAGVGAGASASSSVAGSAGLMIAIASASAGAGVGAGAGAQRAADRARTDSYFDESAAAGTALPQSGAFPSGIPAAPEDLRPLAPAEQSADAGAVAAAAATQSA